MTDFEKRYYEYKIIKYKNFLKILKKPIDRQPKVCYNMYVR
jgi:hypothetical protein